MAWTNVLAAAGRYGPRVLGAVQGLGPLIRNSPAMMALLTHPWVGPAG